MEFFLTNFCINVRCALFGLVAVVALVPVVHAWCRCGIGGVGG